MMADKSNFKIFMRNTIKFLAFGFKMYEQGVCDKPIEGAFKYVEPCETKGYNKEEASNLLNLSVRQFDRRVKRGFINKGRKYRDDAKLYWDKIYIDKMSAIAKK